jgi:hypothetical protein
MTLTSWLRKRSLGSWPQHTYFRGTKARARSFRPRVEPLEERVLLDGSGPVPLTSEKRA